MRIQMDRALAVVIALVAAACGDSTGTGGAGANGGSPTQGGSPVEGGGGAGSGGVPSTGGAGQGGCPSGGAPGQGGAIASCDDIGATACFINDDCPADQRCENASTADEPVPCCQTGPRGTGPLGAPCVSENDCASSLCIEGGQCGGICTDTCSSPADCPADLPQCIPIAFSGSNEDFCLP